MNLIVCDQNCKRQKDGYCTLNQITSLSGSASDKCGYFEVRNTEPEQEGALLSAQDFKGL